LHHTTFADDPDFPAKTSLVREILYPGAPLLSERVGREVVIPDILSRKDYEKYAQQIQPGVLPIGGSAFFEACLPVYFPSVNPNVAHAPNFPISNSALMICGSTHETSKQFIRKNQWFHQIEIGSGSVLTMTKKGKFEKWITDTILIFKQKKKLIIAVKNEEGNPVSSEKVKNLLAKITAEIINRTPVDELLIEGGATAHACLKAAGFTSLVPVREYARGVVWFQILGRENRQLILKPGSYEWPPQLFES
jgi:uncharacterized protein YgbK (DUF1537 family)